MNCSCYGGEYEHFQDMTILCGPGRGWQGWWAMRQHTKKMHCKTICARKYEHLQVTDSSPSSAYDLGQEGVGGGEGWWGSIWKMCCRAVHMGEYISMQDTQMNWVRSLIEFCATLLKYTVTRDCQIWPVLGLLAISIRSWWCEYNLNPVFNSGWLLGSGRWWVCPCETIHISCDNWVSLVFTARGK